MSLRPLPLSSLICMDVTFPCFLSFLFTTEVISIYYIRKQFIIHQELPLEFVIYHFQLWVLTELVEETFSSPFPRWGFAYDHPSQGSNLLLESTSSRISLRQPVADGHTSDHLPIMVAESNQYKLANTRIKYLLPETLRGKGNAYSLHTLTSPSLQSQVHSRE